MSTRERVLDLVEYVKAETNRAERFYYDPVSMVEAPQFRSSAAFKPQQLFGPRMITARRIGRRRR